MSMLKKSTVIYLNDLKCFKPLKIFIFIQVTCCASINTGYVYIATAEIIMNEYNTMC